jgi:ubiquinone/menaquinone biosynthesis C-methylase UbiE
MLKLTDQQKFIESTFNAAADHFDATELPFWDIYGRKSAEKLNLRAGMKILDLCCGTGASAIPAAQMVEPNGQVTAHDLAQNLLDLAKAKAEKAGIENIRFERADMNQLRYLDESFDAIQIVFGNFFSDDMLQTLRKLNPLLKMGGNIVLTTWQDSALEPLNSIWKDELVKIKADAFPEDRPWDIVKFPDGLRSVMQDAGLQNIRIEQESNKLELRHASDWWTMAMGSGYRAFIDMLEDKERNQFREKLINRIQGAGITEYDVSVNYGLATRTVQE